MLAAIGLFAVNALISIVIHIFFMEREQRVFEAHKKETFDRMLVQHIAQTSVKLTRVYPTDSELKSDYRN